MAELKVYLSEELDKRFRMLAMSIFGYGRGSLSEAAVQALSSWCQQHESRDDGLHRVAAPSPESDPVARAEERPGILSPTKYKDTGLVVDQGRTDEVANQDNSHTDPN